MHDEKKTEMLEFTPEIILISEVWLGFIAIYSKLSLDLCKKNGVKTCSVINVIESSIARSSDFILPIHAGPEIGVASTKAFIGQMLVLYILALKISEIFSSELFSVW